MWLITQPGHERRRREASPELISRPGYLRTDSFKLRSPGSYVPIPSTLHIPHQFKIDVTDFKPLRPWPIDIHHKTLPHIPNLLDRIQNPLLRPLGSDVWSRGSQITPLARQLHVQRPQRRKRSYARPTSHPILRSGRRVIREVSSCIVGVAWNLDLEFEVLYHLQGRRCDRRGEQPKLRDRCECKYGLPIQHRQELIATTITPDPR
jgi:hypothetical protein